MGFECMHNKSNFLQDGFFLLQIFIAVTFGTQQRIKVLRKRIHKTIDIDTHVSTLTIHQL